MSEKRSAELRYSCVEIRKIAMLLQQTRHPPPNKYTNCQSDEHHWRVSIPRVRVISMESLRETRGHEFQVSGTQRVSLRMEIYSEKVEDLRK
jgi:hypothetical protein